MMSDYYCPECQDNIVLRCGRDSETGFYLWLCEYCGKEWRTDKLKVRA